ncbi:MAG: zinc carboxypeptidase [Saprospiraceae bacterium]|nr:zinc carboxypeptidase [Saprospiraceae bacterium]
MRFKILACLLVLPVLVFSQKLPPNYYLPNGKYDRNIPTPQQFFGFEIGDWHLSHDQIIAYYKALDAASPRITLNEYGRSHEGRPLVYLTITSEANHANLQSIQNEHLALCDPDKSAKSDVSKMPIVVYQGFSIHGNEQSGANAATLVAYYLAASQEDETLKLLNEAVILLDPCFNPDGMQRFSSWVNANRSKHLNGDPNDREYDEPWPKGRYNHYLFDLNRDWLPGQQPESVGRIANFQAWKPNILTDHHEMGSNSTFFFMPGVPSRVNPLTPKLNQELTAKIGTYHAAALDKIGSLYYSEEGFDDFYFGKGSTYPDAQGCIGILFEQASSRGHLQNTTNGPLSFPFTIQNQVQVAFSTQKAAVAMRTELLDYQRNFYKNNLEEARKDSRKAFVVGERYDHARLMKFVEMVQRQGIAVFETKEKIKAGGTDFELGSSYLIPLEQPQYKLILGMFQRDTTFTDSIFYDISAWTMPLAFNLEYASLNSSQFSKKLLGDEVKAAKKSWEEYQLPGGNPVYYAFEWDGYYAPSVLNKLFEEEIHQIKLATKPFTAETDKGLHEFRPGTIVLSAYHNNPTLNVFELGAIAAGVKVYGLKSGQTSVGPDLGSSSFELLRKPKVALLMGDGVSPTDAGEIWHLLDTRYGMGITKLDLSDATPSILERYNVVIMANGSYGALNAEALRTWVNGGGTLIAVEGAVKWLESKQLGSITLKKEPETASTTTARRPYIGASEDRAANELPGSIFEAELDLTHPLCFGFSRNKLPVFKGSGLFCEAVKSPYASPVVLTKQPLMAGYVPRKMKALAPNSPSVVVTGVGQGRIICMLDNPCFRSFWYGTDKLMANAVFFGNIIASQTVERK